LKRLLQNNVKGVIREERNAKHFPKRKWPLLIIIIVVLINKDIEKGVMKGGKEWKKSFKTSWPLCCEGWYDSG